MKDAIDQIVRNMAGLVVDAYSPYEYKSPEVKRAYAAGVRSTVGYLVAMATELEKTIAPQSPVHKALGETLGNAVRSIALGADILIPPEFED